MRNFFVCAGKSGDKRLCSEQAEQKKYGKNAHPQKYAVADNAACFFSVALAKGFGKQCVDTDARSYPDCNHKKLYGEGVC